MRVAGVLAARFAITLLRVKVYFWHFRRDPRASSRLSVFAVDRRFPFERNQNF
jgi:hypothetical protein